MVRLSVFERLAGRAVTTGGEARGVEISAPEIERARWWEAKGRIADGSAEDEQAA